MFTGIIDHCGVIEDIQESDTSKRFLVKTSFDDLIEGESIAVDGACLTVTGIQNQSFYCDLSLETLAKTISANYVIGRQVNLERAMMPTDRLGGHFVTGHIDEQVTLFERKSVGEFLQMRIKPQKQNALKYVVAKGSVALNGVSLTVNAVDEEGFEIMLIPHTLDITNLKHLYTGDQVNIEYDMLAKIVAKQVEVVNAND